LACAEELDQLSLAAFTDRIRAGRYALAKEGFSASAAGQALGVVREAAARTLGLRPESRLVAAAWGLLNGGLVELDDYEERRLCAALAACTAALAGIQAHLVLREDTAAATADWLQPLAVALGQSVGVATDAESRGQRQRAYRAPVVCATAKVLCLDHLNDRLALRGHLLGDLRLNVERLYGDESLLSDLMLRGLPFAIIDELDEILIDEAGVPVALTRQEQAPENELLAHRSMELARRLDPIADYEVEDPRRQVRLTEPGRAKLADLSSSHGGMWAVPRLREEMVTQAVVALVLYDKDKHYRVENGRIVVLGEQSGAQMADRYWGAGLHRLIEIKEGCEPSGERVPVTRTTYQGFFRRYQLLSGMTLGAREAQRELRSVFGLHAVGVGGKRGADQTSRRAESFVDDAAKWEAVVDRAGALKGNGRRVVICVRTVEGARRASTLLSEAALAHGMAATVELGDPLQMPEAILVITGDALRKAITRPRSTSGGSGETHLILAECEDERRLEDKIIGCLADFSLRSVSLMVSPEDPLLAAPGRASMAGTVLAMAPYLGQRCASAALRLAQREKARQRTRARRQLLKTEERVTRAMAFSGTAG
jgi:preprotein translocase subunit SecA